MGMALEELERMDLVLLIEVAWRMLWPAGIPPGDFGTAAELALVAQARESWGRKKTSGGSGTRFNGDGRVREGRSVPTSRAVQALSSHPASVSGRSRCGPPAKSKGTTCSGAVRGALRPRS
jgi:hypothetical protein